MLIASVPRFGCAQEFELLATMIPEYDIFRVHTDGTPIWLGPANTLDDAQARIRQLRATKPGDYFIFNQTTAEMIVLKAGPQTDWPN
jgi:hypothetical protein